jgi:hypothetical protein
MDKGDMKAKRFADYRAIFRRALELVNRGGNVNEALSEANRELYPYTYRDIEPNLREIFNSCKRSHQWGDMRALRDLAENAGAGGMAEEAEQADAPAYEDSMANLKDVFRVAHKKASVGFQPADALEMACKDLYPYTSRKVLKAAEEQLRKVMDEKRTSPKGALKLLSEGGNS